MNDAIMMFAGGVLAGWVTSTITRWTFAPSSASPSEDHPMTVTSDALALILRDRPADDVIKIVRALAEETQVAAISHKKSVSSSNQEDELRYHAMAKASS